MEIPITYCLCGNPYDPEQFMIQCDVCKDWFHGTCVAIKEYMSTDFDKYHCPRCEPISGPSIMKVRMNWHRHDHTEENADTKPVQTGTAVFIRELKSRHFPKADEMIKRVRGQQLTLQYLQNHGFSNPIIIDGKDGLDMTLPPSNFSVYDIESYIGGDREMDVIDVTKQNNIRMKLRDFVEYYNDPCRTRVLNVISLEFTDTGLSPLVEAPYIARKLDWVNNVWPRNWPEDNELKKPEVQKYCLMGVKDSYTDFHIDFGGTSVWYHVLRGEKIFYLIKPTAANVQLYQQWMCSSTQSETFFGDQADACYKCVIKEGQTMMIPTGWIHAVLTPEDSLVFGGNFLHSLNIPMQIQIYELERKMKTPSKFQYPGFETIHWFAAKKMCKELKDLNSEDKKCPEYFLIGVKALLAILKQWNTDKDYNMTSRGQIPETISSQKLLKDFSKEIRHAERFLMALNPPKPERESKRKKKKPVNKDFVNFDVADKMPQNPFRATLKDVTKTESPVKSLKVEPPIPPIGTPPLKLTLPKTASYPFVKTTPPTTKLAKSPKSVKAKTPKTPKIPKVPKVPKAPKLTKTTKSPSKKKLSSENKKRLSKPGKQSPTVIRFKLGDNEVVRSTKDDIYGNFAISNCVETKKEFTWKQSSSIYDFHDGSNESDYGGFTIDESPKRKKSSKSSSQKQQIKREFDNVQIISDVPKNGIEELLKASVYTLDPGSPRPDISAATVLQGFPESIKALPAQTGSGRASPSTRDAIAGMLSFSEQCYSTTSTAAPTKTIKTNKTMKVEEELEDIDETLMDDDDQLIENIDKVHQDEDFIYPTLDASDDEEFIFKPRGKRMIDEAWNPKARVGPLLPKTNRPAREGAKKTSVEKGLEAAAAKRAKQSEDYSDDDEDKVLSKKKLSSSKRTYKQRKQKNPPKELPPSIVSEPMPVLTPPPVMNVKSAVAYSSILTSPNRLKDVKAKLAAPVPVERKPKKGMKTAKQRLGKILKLHKMMH